MDTRAPFVRYHFAFLQQISAVTKATAHARCPVDERKLLGLLGRVTDANMLKQVVTQILDIVLMDPQYSNRYAELCCRVAPYCPAFEMSGRRTNFRRLLLTLCQEEFEKKRQYSLDDDGDKPQGTELQAMAKARMLGNITFIGELYKLGMLTERIMHEIVFRRLLEDINNPVEADMEALCRLMNIAGKVLDAGTSSGKAKGYMDGHFKCIDSLAQNPNISSRIRGMLQDLVELRKNSWALPTPTAVSAPDPHREEASQW